MIFRLFLAVHFPDFLFISFRLCKPPPRQSSHSQQPFSLVFFRETIPPPGPPSLDSLTSGGGWSFGRCLSISPEYLIVGIMFVLFGVISLGDFMGFLKWGCLGRDDPQPSLFFPMGFCKVPPPTKKKKISQPLAAYKHGNGSILRDFQSLSGIIPNFSGNFFKAGLNWYPPKRNETSQSTSNTKTQPPTIIYKPSRDVVS